jgi:hypothetical protein
VGNGCRRAAGGDPENKRRAERVVQSKLKGGQLTSEDRTNRRATKQPPIDPKVTLTRFALSAPAATQRGQLTSEGPVLQAQGLALNSFAAAVRQEAVAIVAAFRNNGPSVYHPGMVSVVRYMAATNPI